MRFKFECSSCSTRLEALSTQSGTQLPCPDCGASTLVPKIALQPDVTLGDFVIEAQIGQGGMGTVFRARQLSMDRRVALKVLPEALSRNATLMERFTQEIRVTARLEHPNIVTAHFAGEDDGYHYFAMSLIDGDSLGDRVVRDGAIPEAEAIQYALQVIDALEYAWDEHQILHRDIKPANIMLDQRGEIKLLDMGIAKSLREESALTTHGEFIGTPNYVSPEQARGDMGLDCRADIYSLGATLYDMVAGEQPFTGKSVFEVLTKIVKEMPEPADAVNPEVSAEMGTLLNRLMSKSREDRPGSYDELRRLLTQLQQSSSETVLEASPLPAPTTRTTKRWPWLLAVLVFMLGLVLMLGHRSRINKDNRRAGRILTTAREQVVLIPQEIVVRLEAALPTFHPKTDVLGELKQLLTDARELAKMKPAFGEAHALATDGKSREALATLESIVTSDTSPLLLEAQQEMAAEVHRAVLKQRTMTVIELLLAGKIDAAAQYVDPAIIQQRSLPVVKIGLGVAVAYCRLSKVTAADFAIDDIEFAAGFQTATLIGRVRVNGQWQNKPGRCVRRAGDWYLLL